MAIFCVADFRKLAIPRDWLLGLGLFRIQSTSSRI